MDNNLQSEKDSMDDIQTNAFSADNEAPKLYSRSDEEYSAEVADVSASRIQNRPAQLYAPRKAAETGRGWGLTAVILAIAAWFIWPLLLAPAAVIAGIVAFVKGRKGYGSLAVIIGLIAFFTNMGNAIL